LGPLSGLARSAGRAVSGHQHSAMTASARRARFLITLLLGVTPKTTMERQVRHTMVVLCAVSPLAHAWDSTRGSLRWRSRLVDGLKRPFLSPLHGRSWDRALTNLRSGLAVFHCPQARL